MSLKREAQLRRLNRYGPWILGGAAILAAIGYEAARHHVIDQFEVIYFCCLVPTVVLHEIAHGLVAYWCGDDTAKQSGRLSLNPLRHVDPLGTILLPILLILTVHQSFGWAKPVPVNVGRLRHPRNQAVLVGLAGPATNVLIAVIAGVWVHIAFTRGIGVNGGEAFNIPFILGEVNVIIAAFNLIPIPPLDGSAVLERFLPARALPRYYQLRQLSMILVLLLVFVDGGAALDTVFSHILNWWANMVL